MATSLRGFAPPRADDAVLSEIVQRIVALYRPERVYLFGSTARGDAGPDSDYDLLVIVPDDTPAELRRAGPAYLALWDLGVGADVVIYTKTAFERRVGAKSSLPATVMREGKLVYGA